MKYLPTRKDEKLIEAIFRALRSLKRRTIADEIRPIVEAELEIDESLSRGQFQRWAAVFSWALIDLRRANIVQSPFGERMKNDETKRKCATFIATQFPNHKVQQIWELQTGTSSL